MKLQEFKSLLETNREKAFRLQLPGGSQVPVSFHITEVGLVSKTFIDCGGKVHSVQTCQLQAWGGEDIDHRLEAGKMADILRLSKAIVPNDFLDVEIEYEDTLISQYPVSEAIVSDDAVTLHLTTKHTDCLAKELCLAPSANGSSCCGSSGCC
jgi:Family of unknown function (DUF6428)